MTEVRADVVVGVKERGFAKIAETIRKFAGDSQKATDGQVRGFVDARKEVKNLDGAMRDLSRRQVDMHRAMRGAAAGTEEYKKLNKQLQESNKQMGRMRSHAQALRSAFKMPEKAQGAFTQGVMQGVMPGAAGFLQRGPGMRRQFTGQMAGRAARGAVGGAASAFTGVGGLAQAISGVPLVGGALAGQLQTTAGFVGASMGHKRATMGADPFLGINANQRVMAARRRGRAGAGSAPEVAFGSRERAIDMAGAAAAGQFAMGGGAKMSPDMEARFKGFIDQTAKANAQKKIDEYREYSGKPMSARMQEIALRTEKLRMQRGGEVEAVRADWQKKLDQRGGHTEVTKARKEKADEIDSAARAFRDRKEERGRQAAAAEKQRLFGGIRRAGVNIAGISQTEAVQRAAAMTQVGGGDLAEMQQQGMLRTGFAAQTRFGVGADVSGAFLQAGRRGGLTGGVGLTGGPTSADEMTSAIGDALSLGLKGSELTDYMQQVANGITSWKSTGIPFNRTSMKELTGGLGAMGLDAVRGGRVAAGIGAAGERVAAGGAQSVQDLMIMETLGGFQGGGLKEMQAAMIRLEEKDYEEGALQKLLTQFGMAGGGVGTAGGQLAIGDILKSIGIDVSRGEAKKIGETLAGGGQLSNRAIEEMAREDERKAAGARRAEAETRDPEALIRAAKGAVPGAIKRQAVIENRQMAIGNRMTSTVQNLEEASKTINKGFTDLTAGPLKDVTGQIAEFAEVFPQMIKTMRMLVDRLD